MIDEEARRLRAYHIWESEGRPERQELAHWYQAADVESGPAGEGAHYLPYSSSAAPAGSLVIKFYNSGDQIRGYLRKVADTAKDDVIFPGEEMEPDAAFRLAKSHNSGSGQPVFIELVEGVTWDPSWGTLGNESFLETVPTETDDGRAGENPAAKRRRSNLAKEADKGLRRAVAENGANTETVAATVQERQRGRQ